MGGRSLKLTDTTEPRQGATFQTEARPCEAEARPSQLKKTASRPHRAEADASRTTSLVSAEGDPLGIGYGRKGSKTIIKGLPDGHKRSKIGLAV